MSDTSTTVEAVAPSVETAPVVADSGTPSAPVDAPPVADAATSAQEPTVPAGDLYTVKIDGQDHEVTLDELRNGYSRTSDYTRKTQELAEQRAEHQQAVALAAAFKRDPHATMAALAEAYNWTPQQAAQFAAEQAPVEAAPQVPFEELDPAEQRIARVEQYIQEQERQQTQARIEQDFATLESQYGQIDRDAVTTHAITKGVDLVTAYRDMQFDATRANAQALEAKRAAQVVEGGATVQQGAVSAPPPSGSLRDTIRAAIRAGS